jgi:DNA invertase Pin-like site-specific DNA recombinase
VLQTGLGIDRQREDCLRLADLRRWTIKEFYVDNDLSAYKRHVVRPDFERMLNDLSIGRIDGIIVYDLDRFVRQPRDLERAIELFDKRSGLVFSSVQSDFDLQSSDGRTMARVLVAFANKASMDTARRVARMHRQLATRGFPAGGRYRPFGFMDDKVTPDPVESELIREAAQQILGGVGLSAISRQWNEAKVLTPAENEWKHTPLKNVFLAPRIAGFRGFYYDEAFRPGMHRRKAKSIQIAKDADGNPVRLTARDGSVVTPILDQNTWESVVALLTKPQARRQPRKSFLGGLLRCFCGQALYANFYLRTGKDWHAYRCACGNSIAGPATDQHMAELLFRKSAERQSVTRSKGWPGEAELAEAQRKVNEALAAFEDKPGASIKLILPTLERLQNRITDLQNKRTLWIASQSRMTTRATQRKSLRSQWETMTVDQMRAAIEVEFSAVVVRASSGGGKKRFDPNRLHPIPVQNR